MGEKLRRLVIFGQNFGKHKWIVMLTFAVEGVCVCGEGDVEFSARGSPDTRNELCAIAFVFTANRSCHLFIVLVVCATATATLKSNTCRQQYATAQEQKRASDEDEANCTRFYRHLEVAY